MTQERFDTTPAPSNMIPPKCPGMDKCLRPECSTQCAIHGPEYVAHVKPIILEALMEPCKGCGKAPIDFLEGSTPPASTEQKMDELRGKIAPDDERLEG